MEKETPADPSKDPIQRAFRKGNINFDFLQPEEVEEAYQEKPEDRRRHRREGKRGLFNRGRKVKPYGRPAIFGWMGLFSVSLVMLVWIAVQAVSFIWLTLIPVLLATLFWSMIMLVLLKARPR